MSSPGSASKAVIAERKLAEINRPGSSFKERAEAEKARFKLATDSEYWVCLCFETREQKQEFLTAVGHEDGDKHVDGLALAARLGITLESPRVEWPKPRS